MTASERLSSALAHLRGPELEALANRAGTSIAAARCAARGRDQRGRSASVDSYLKLCAAIGIDPVTGAPCIPETVGAFHPNSLGCALRMLRIQLDETQRQFANAAKLSTSAVCRIERGEPVEIENMLKACAFMARHPLDFVSPPTSRETLTETAPPRGPNSLRHRIRSSRANRKVPITLASTAGT